MRPTKLLFILPLFALLLLLAGCVSFKPHGKTGTVKQVYHDITARNNGYFNANERIKKVKDNIVNTRKDNYDTILSVYTDRDPEVAKAYSSDLDEVIKKTSTVIQNHEPSIFTDNSYFLVGESYYLKGDFDNALLTFQFVNTEFKEKPTPRKPQTAQQQKTKGKPQTAAQKAAATSGDKSGGSSSKNNSKKPMTALQKKQFEEQEAQKEAERAAAREKELQMKNVAKDSTSKAAVAAVESSTEKGKEDPLHMFKHQPVRPDAMIWLTDTYTELKKYKEAEAVLTIIDADQNFPSWLKLDVEIARANLFVKKGDFNRAIPPLTYLTQKIKGRHKRVRYEYILAQIFERQRNNAEAIGHYKEVIDGKPQYQMGFNAKMSLARLSLIDNSMPSGDVVKLLKKLLKDGKYREFYDQVYFALAELSLKAGNRTEAMTYYKKCIDASTANTSQKAKAYLRLGELYFDDENYVVSQPYYDSTLNLIGKDDPKKSQVTKRNSILKNLVTQTNIIQNGDSMIRLSAMSDNDREKLVDKLIQDEEDKKEQQAQNEKIKFDSQAATATVDVTGSWYFDNPIAKGSGYNDFVKRWGNRKLEDNWRRSDKSSFDSNDTTDKAAVDTSAGSKKDSKENLTLREKMLKNIPSSDAEVQKTKDKMVEAYYNLANIYSIELKNTPKAIATFEELLKRFPENKYLAETYYNLFLLYAKAGNQAKSDEYKDLVLGKYPNSKFANIIRDPNYLEREKKANNAVADYYSTLFQLYQQGQYDTLVARKPLIDSMYQSNSMKPKFDLLIAYAIGKSKDLRAYKDALQSIVKLYPGDEAKTKAEEILKYIDKSTDSTVRMENNMLRYEYNPESKHFFLISLKGDVKATDVVIKIAQYNDANNSLDKLKIEPLILPDGNTIITVKSFENLAKAKNYYDAFTRSTTLASFPKQNINYYMISDVNMNKVIINKEINSYFDYFNVKYIK